MAGRANAGTAASPPAIAAEIITSKCMYKPPCFEHIRYCSKFDPRALYIGLKNGNGIEVVQETIPTDNHEGNPCLNMYEP